MVSFLSYHLIVASLEYVSVYFGTVLYKLALVRIEVYIVSTKTTGSEKDLWVGILYCLLEIEYLAFVMVYLSFWIWD